jgi:energy-coupling factor transport system substrate-specific component
VVAALVAFIVVQSVFGISQADEAAQNLFVAVGIAAVIVGVVVAVVAGRTVFAFRDGDPAIRTWLVAAAAIAAALLTWAVLRLVFQPSGYLSTIDGSPTSILPGLDLSFLALDDPLGLIAVTILAVIVGAGAWLWASKGENARFFPVWVGGLTTGIVAAIISAPIAAGVFGGVTGTGTDALVALYRTLGLSVFQSAFAQGLTSDPLDKTISYTIVAVILGALPITVRAMFSRGESTVVA